LFAENNIHESVPVNCGFRKVLQGSYAALCPAGVLLHAGFGGKKVSQLPTNFVEFRKNFANNCCNNKAAQQLENQ
jgi:hypothetical protein